jgi:Uma2 family endonuclease
MATTATLVTVREFLQMPEPEGQKLELIGGEVISMGRGGRRHEFVKSNVMHIVVAWLLQNPIGRVFAERTFELDEHNSPIPDLSVIFPVQISTAGTDLIRGAPALAIEIVASETAARLETKIELYLAHGSKSVWAVFPEQRVVRIFSADGRSQKFEQSQTLEDPTVLPGFKTPVSAIFEGL